MRNREIVSLRARARESMSNGETQTIRRDRQWIFREQRRQVDSAKKITHRETETAGEDRDTEM